MLHVLFGEDDFSIRQALEEIKKSIGDPGALMTNTTVLEAKQVTPEQLRAACETVPFLADKRLVVVEGLLERFETKAKTTKKKSSRRNDQEEACKAIAEAVKQLPPFTELVITGGKTGTNNPLLQALMPLGKIKSFPVLKDRLINQWIEKRLAALGKDYKISPKAVTLLVRLVGNDLWTMANEIDKLVLFTGGRLIDEADVKAVVSSAHDASVFSMVDAILELRIGAAQQLLQQLFQQGMAPAQVLVMLARQVRIILQVREMRERGRARGEIQAKLGLASDYVLRKAWDQADKYSPARIREVYHQLLETDIAIKTGKMEGELALDVLMAQLGQRGTVSA
ncbi:MAG: DNA polymerase III subunit delta [Dehalococcoidales bacterium]